MKGNGQPHQRSHFNPNAKCQAQAAPTPNPTERAIAFPNSPGASRCSATGCVKAQRVRAKHWEIDDNDEKR
ncbi:MAG: hypothetical protein KME17_03650 [Cyanosarcina radialis HA8281-LM2]|jgi:hypothetical protein|nr:hypothetical protein [Cyanosarcina radialis HA8281-LM2]